MGDRSPLSQGLDDRTPTPPPPPLSEGLDLSLVFTLYCGKTAVMRELTRKHIIKEIKYK